jgi:hypothetical protein
MWLLPLKQTIPLHVTVCRREETWQRRKLQPRKLLHQRRLLARKKLLVRRRLLARRRLQPRRSNSSFLLQLALRRSGLAKWRIVHKPLLASVSSGFFVAWDHRPVPSLGPVRAILPLNSKPLGTIFAASANLEKRSGQMVPSYVFLLANVPEAPRHRRDNHLSRCRQETYDQKQFCEICL